MKTINKFIGAIIAVSLMSTAVYADSLLFSGGGASTVSKSTTTVGANVEYEVSLAKDIGVSLSQGFGYSDSQGSKFVGDTGIGMHYYIGHARLRPFFGGSVSADYGATSLKWNVTPEVGVRYYINKDSAFLFGKVGYDFLLSGRSLNAGDSIAYKLGLGISFK